MIFHLPRTIRRATLLSALLVFVFQIAGQEGTGSGFDTDATRASRVGVATLFADPADSRLQAVRTTVADTIALNLTLLDQYEVSRIATDDGAGMEDLEDSSDGRFLEWAAATAETGGFDFVVAGVAAASGASIVLDLAVFDRSAGEIVISHDESVAQIIEIFAAADAAASAMVEAFADEVLQFATLDFAPEGDGAWRVLIDGSEIGENVEEQRILAGTRTVEIVQERVFGPFTIHEEQLSLAEDERAVVSFAVPQISDVEADPAAVLAILNAEHGYGWSAPEPLELRGGLPILRGGSPWRFGVSGGALMLDPAHLEELGGESLDDQPEGLELSELDPAPGLTFLARLEYGRIDRAPFAFLEGSFSTAEVFREEFDGTTNTTDIDRLALGGGVGVSLSPVNRLSLGIEGGGKLYDYSVESRSDVEDIGSVGATDDLASGATVFGRIRLEYAISPRFTIHTDAQYSLLTEVYGGSLGVSLRIGPAPERYRRFADLEAESVAEESRRSVHARGTGEQERREAVGELVRLYGSAGDIDRAVAIYDEHVGGGVVWLQPSDPEVARTLLDLAGFLYADGREEEARTRAEAALSVARRIDDNRLAGNALSLLARGSIDSGETERAIEEVSMLQRLEAPE